MKKLYLFALLLVLAFLSIQLVLSRLDSQTTDEAVHIAAGYTYLKTNDYRFNPEHPPPVKKLAALPLLFMKLDTPDPTYWNAASSFFYDSWRENRQFGEDLIYSLKGNVQEILFATRIPMVLLSVALAIAVFMVSYRMWGGRGAIISLGLCLLDPLINGHSHLVTTDVAVSLGFLLSLYCFWIFLNAPSYKNALLLGLIVGFTQLFKFTAIIVYPAFLVLFLGFIIYRRVTAKSLLRIFGKIILSLAVILLVIFVGYGFSFYVAPKSDVAIEQLGQDTGFNDMIVEKISQSGSFREIYDKARYVLVPKEYYKGLVMVFSHTRGGHDSYLLGETSKTGWWYYFPILVLLKTPIPALILVAVGLYFALKDKDKKKTAVFMLSGAFLFLLFAMSSKANLGLRHVMPIFPVLYVLSGSLGLLKSRKLNYLVLALFIWLVGEYIVAFPYYLSYFNQLAGGKWNGYKIASDSNFDWGQDLYRIKKYLDYNPGIDEPYIEYSWSGESALDYFGIKRRPLSELNAESKGYLIIGSSALVSEKYDWLREGYSPVDRITPSVFVYYLE
ncbi:MAG: glycosyltransferase family 39 protein [Candidatus Berkelbacteria bacterium]|nr:glycosyltransferase family 39 protein [Candidatus Berkelbacteria bacterium]